MERNDPCWCGSGKKWKKCHYPRPPTSQKEWYQERYNIHLKTQEEIEKISLACQVTVEILDILARHAKEGVTTQELDLLSRKLHQELGAIPAPLGYGSPPFPASICTSLNEVICHGIPDSRKLQNGDILNIDVSAIVDGYFGDASRMVEIGEVSPDKKLVVATAKECLLQAISICGPSVPIWKIGETIETVARSKGCSVVYQFIGHGVGIAFHENPEIPHCYNKVDIPMAPGMIFTIEPMINRGVPDAVIDADEWTARTKDKKPSAQWEHTILIEETGAKILTPWKDPL